MKAQNFKFLENEAQKRVEEYFYLYKNNKVFLDLKEKGQVSNNIDYNRLEMKNKKYKEYIMIALNLKSDCDFENLIRKKVL